MAESRSIAERDTAGVEPLALSRRTVGAVLVIALVLWISAFLLWKQVDFLEPPDSHLAFHLTPGEVTFANIDGMMEVPTKQIFPS